MARFFRVSRSQERRIDLHVQDLKRHEKLDGVLGVNLGTGLSAGGSLTIHQELIMTMSGAGKHFTGLRFSHCLYFTLDNGTPF